ncbi:MAG: DNA gyrase/topoisomerase IV subunit A [Alphaproteobacteria bacterium]|nr:DNA gyrase/topoisomerase IV subunit A [Alphaproteobacteria bacterium]
MDETDERNGSDNPELESGELTQTVHLSDMYQNWFLDYASYVILERAVPEITDGLKPVQRRILHAMKELDDGRFNKVANIIGHTMKYHPHGDASIGDALVQLGQKELLVETQGNWGNILTGDSAAAPRYIEARPSKFAMEVLFNPKTTVWQSSYDGRNKEPVALPAKFPLLLAQGVEGIAVGLASKILPHNFNELIDASIKILQDQEFELYPDFLTGGLADVSRYNDGLRGGKIRLRARINVEDKKTLAIREIPYGTTTSSIIDSILAANDKGKIKIRKIDDNTARDVEILIHLSPGVSPDTTMDALYAFTECEVSISPNSCVIENGKPRFMGVSEILKYNTDRTVELLRLELEIRRQELLEQLYYSSLEKIFIENEVYEGIKKCKTSDEIDAAILKGLKPFLKQLLRKVTEEDIHKLRKIPIERISRFNSTKADEVMKGLQMEIDEVENHLAHLTDFAIEYFRQIRKKFGKNRDRRTEIRSFDTIEAVKVAAANQKLYVNREEGFAGTGLKKDEYVCDCSDLDEIIVFRDDGTFLVTKIADKQFVGKSIIHIAVFKKNDNRTVYNLVYRDGKNGKIMIKRFSVLGVNRDKEYAVTKGTPGSKILYFTANPNGEAEVVRVDLKPKPRLKKSGFDFDFAGVAIRGRSSMGNILTKYAVKKIEQRQEGVSTLGSLNIWFDDSVQRLNTEGRGLLLGDFSGSDRIITFTQSGSYRLTSFDLSTHFEEDMFLIEKFVPETVYTVVYQDHETNNFYVKRFQAESTDRRIDFVEEPDRMVLFSKDRLPRLLLIFDMKLKSKGAEHEEIYVADFIGVKGYKAKGKRLTTHAVKKIDWLEPAAGTEPEVESLPPQQAPTQDLLSQATESPSIGMDRQEKENQPGEGDHTPSGSVTTRPEDAPFGLIAVETISESAGRLTEEVPVAGTSPEIDTEGMVRLEPEPVKEAPPGKKGRKKKVDPGIIPPGEEDDNGDAIQMELPL